MYWLKTSVEEDRLEGSELIKKYIFNERLLGSYKYVIFKNT